MSGLWACGRGAELRQTGRYPRGSEAVADLCRAEVLLYHLLIGKPLWRQEAGECHRAGVPEEPGQEELMGACSKSPLFHP